MEKSKSKSDEYVEEVFTFHKAEKVQAGSVPMSRITQAAIYLIAKLDDIGAGAYAINWALHGDDDYGETIAELVKSLNEADKRLKAILIECIGSNVNDNRDIAEI